MLIDTTLREGHQRFGLYMDLPSQQKIMEMSACLGMEEIEAGVAGRDENLSSLISFGRTLSAKPRISIWSPLRVESISAAQNLGPDIINIGVPVSDLHLKNRLGISREKLLKRLADVMLLFQKSRALLSIGLEDLSRADHGFALEVARTFADSGGWRVRLSDSVGLLSPREVLGVVEKFRHNLEVKLAFHSHNDLGMATGNSVSALDAGCDFVDVSVLGIGERSGIARLEEVMTWLVLKKNKGYSLRVLPDLCAYVAGLAGINIDNHRPVIGSEIFNVETGLHVDGIYKNPELFEPFDPARLGHKRFISLGGKSGQSAVKAKISQLLLNSREYNIEELTCRVRATAMATGHPISDRTFLKIAQEQKPEHEGLSE
ncbi:MAG: LeuA family protein [Desulfonatronovibrio sp.]